MTNKEYHQIKTALARWFYSQSVGLPDAAVVMGTLIAQITAELSESESDMDDGIRSFVKGFKNTATKIKRDKYDRVRR
jgi:hypothetical protein